MYKRKRVTAVILAAGNGSRMGIPTNKVLLPLDEQQIVSHALGAFAAHRYVDDLILVARAGEEEWIEQIAQVLTKPVRIVIGGATRQASVYHAIADLKSEIVLVHDGARPLIGEGCITACVEALDRYDGVIPALFVEEQIYSVGEKRGKKPRLLSQPLYGAQTPQCFNTAILRRCHERHRNNANATDDSSLLELEGYKVGVVEGEALNIKITTPLDLLLAKAYIDNPGRSVYDGLD